MATYVCATIISIIFAFISIKLKKINTNLLALNKRTYGYILEKLSAICSFLPLFLVSAIRYNVGTDYLYRYVPGFIIIASGGKETFEVGFILINKFALLFSKDYVVLFVITSFIFCFFVYKAIYQQSEDICFSILLLLITTSFFVSMNIVRQSMSISIFLYATKYIKENNLKKYLIFILIAATFHSSALIYIPIFFVCKRSINLKKQIFVLCVVIIAKPILGYFFNYIISLSKYSHYIGSIYDTGIFSFWTFIINASILIFCYIFYKRGKDDENYKIFVNIQFILVLLLLCSDVIPHISRIIINFTFSQIIFLPKIIKYIKISFIRKSAKIVIIICYVIYMINTIVIKGYHEVLPYQTIFSR